MNDKDSNDLGMHLRRQPREFAMLEHAIEAACVAAMDCDLAIGDLMDVVRGEWIMQQLKRERTGP